jgi:hypothetical protein
VRSLGILALALVLFTLVVNAFLPARNRAAAAGSPPTLHDDARLPVIDGPSGKSRIQPKYTHVASVVAGVGTEVRCWSVSDWQKRESEWGNWNGRALGRWGAYTVRWPEIPNAYRIHLSPAICASLDRLAYQDVPVEQDAWPEALAWSVSALAHESQHARGIADEALAECYGVQKIQATAEALGRTAEEGRFLASLYWRKNYVTREDSEYRSPDCRDGGTLDLRPETHVWP